MAVYIIEIAGHWQVILQAITAYSAIN